MFPRITFFRLFILFIGGFFSFITVRNFINYRMQDHCYVFTKEIEEIEYQGEMVKVHMYWADDRENRGINFLRVLAPVFTFSDLDGILEQLDQDALESYETPYVTIEKIGGIIMMSADAPNMYELMVTVNNFRTMVSDWRRLTDEGVPKVYFLKKYDGTIIVRDSLEG